MGITIEPLPKGVRQYRVALLIECDWEPEVDHLQEMTDVLSGVLQDEMVGKAIDVNIARVR